MIVRHTDAASLVLMRDDAPPEPAGIQYLGLVGCSRECLKAVMGLLQTRVPITLARILSCSGRHCLLLSVETGGTIAIKSGFRSAYLPP